MRLHEQPRADGRLWLVEVMTFMLNSDRQHVDWRFSHQGIQELSRAIILARFPTVIVWEFHEAQGFDGTRIPDSDGERVSDTSSRVTNLLLEEGIACWMRNTALGQNPPGDGKSLLA
jgi:hypothetical protein